MKSNNIYTKIRTLKQLLLLSVFFLFFGNAFAQSAIQKHQTRIAFYNVENLFDTIDDPVGNDEEFLPTAPKKWTNERYQKKIGGIAQIMGDLDHPSVIGFCEVENRTVLEDLAKHKVMQSSKYQVVHFDSPDFRGIDVGLMYQKKHFKVLAKDKITINFPKEIVEDYTTRDVLVVKGKLRKKHTIYFFVNHWPSRRGGLKASSPKREYVAARVRERILNIQKNEPNALFILMGDFNDEPDNISILKVLEKDNLLVNAMDELDQAGEGTYNYRGNWNMIDQFIVSPQLNDDNAKLYIEDVGIFRGEYLFYKDKKYGKRPSRTYGGKRYFGGYSDHLPIYMDLVHCVK